MSKNQMLRTLLKEDDVFLHVEERCKEWCSNQ